MDGTEAERIFAGLVSMDNDTNAGCCIKMCRNSMYHSDIVYFTIPQELSRQNAWLKLLTESIDDTQETSQLQVCSDHFQQKDIIYNDSQPHLMPAALPNIQQNIHTGNNTKDQLMVKMECISEAEEGIQGNLETDPQFMGKKYIYSNDKSSNIPSNSEGKFIKEENVLREIENSLGEGEISGSDTNNRITTDVCPPSTNPTDAPTVLKRKRGRPKKGTHAPRMIPSQQTSNSVNHQDSINSFLFEKTSKTNRASFLSYDSTEDPGDGETDSEMKPKRKRRSKILDDFVADFNTSEEEDDSFLSSFPKFPSRGRGRGRGKRAELPDPFDDDLFSSYIGVFGKKFSIEDDFPSDSLLGEINDSDEDLFLSSNIDSAKVPHVSIEDNIDKDELKGVLGPDGNTKVQIVNTGQIEVIDNEEFILYNVITNTGPIKTITPLRIPKITSNSQNETDVIKSQPSTSHTRPNEHQQDTERSKTELVSPSKKKKHKQIISQQVASLRQRYYRALQELRKRPRVYTLADLVYGASSFLSEDQLIFFTLQLKYGCSNTQGVRFSVREKMLALAFYLQSPGLYKWVRSVFHLPSKLILDRWLEGVAKTDPDAAKRLMYHVYTRYIFKT